MRTDRASERKRGYAFAAATALPEALWLRPNHFAIYSGPHPYTSPTSAHTHHLPAHPSSTISTTPLLNQQHERARNCGSRPPPLPPPPRVRRAQEVRHRVPRAIYCPVHLHDTFRTRSRASRNIRGRERCDATSPWYRYSGLGWPRLPHPFSGPTTAFPIHRGRAVSGASGR